MKKSILFTLFVVALLLSACGGEAAAPVPTLPPVQEKKSIVVAEGTLLPDPSVELAFAQTGIVAEILVAEGERAAEGQVIAKLENSEALQAEVARAEESYLTAQQAFNASHAAALRALAEAHEALRKAELAYDNFDVPVELREMTTREAMEFTYAKLEEARTNFEPYKYLEERLEWEMRADDPANPKVYRDTAKIYKKRLDDAWADYRKAIQWAELEANVEAAKAKMKNAQAEFDNLTAGENAEQMAVARAQFESALASLNAARAALDNSQLRAPFAATVLSLDLSVGETVNAGVPVAFLGDLERWQVETKDLAEIDVANISIGDKVTVKLDAFPDEEFAGVVSRVDPVGREYLGDMTYKTTVALDKSDPRFRWNMTATVTIEIGIE
ncbi:MAG: efflux RND transporter periplasmic adaptor subunit [Chloroflexi bacterium]|nr:efflux RND transporter periplasmic adaptor subunit [Chloroflexota bacterium]